MRTLSLPKPNVKLRTAWFEVLCESDINATFKARVEFALRNKGYISDKKHVNLDLERLLKNFQQDNNLPIGGYNLPTMQALGLK